MPTAIPLPTRQLIVQRHLNGESLPSIACALDLSVWTVRKLWRRYARNAQQGVAALPARYEQCGQHGPQAHPLIYRAALHLKRAHPGWGGGLVCQILRQRWPHLPVPTQRTLQRWWRQKGLNQPRRRLPPQNRSRGGQPHQVWQVDATDQLKLADGTYASWLLVSDEASGALLAAEVFPPQTLAIGDPLDGAASITSSIRAVGSTNPRTSG